MPILLGLDLGTTSHSVVAIDGQRRVVAEWNRDHHAEVSGLPSGYAEQNPKIHLNSAVSLLKDIAAQCPEPPVGLGITGQMHGVVFSDGAGRAVSPVITWQDKRAAQPNPLTGKTDLETLLERCPDSAIQSSGCRLSTGYLGTTCYSLQRAAQIPDRATTASLLISWMGAQLTGEKVVTDPSAAGSTGLYDLERGCWSEPLVEAVGISLSLLPEVRSSGEPIGTLCSKVSAETGLPREMAIMNPLGDNQASVMGSVPQATKEIQVTVGTGGQINWPVDRFVRVPAMDTRSLPDNRFLLVGAGIVGGATYAWLNDTVRQWLATFGVELDREGVYERLNALSAIAFAEPDRIDCVPYFRGTRVDPQSRGSFQNIGLTNFTPGHLAAAVCRGMAETFHQLYESAGGVAPERVQRIIAGGNGIRRNRTLALALAERFQCPVLLPRHTETAAFGAALLAGVKLGVFPNLESATSDLLDGAHAIECPLA